MSEQLKDPVKEKSNFGTWNAQFVTRYASWILVGIFLLCATAFPYAKNLKLHANFVELLPKNSPSIVNLKELTNHVGGTTYLICVIESPDEETAKAAAEQFTEKAAKFPGIDYIDNRSNVPAFENRQLLFLNLESVHKLKKDVLDLLGYYRRKANPFFVDLLKEKAPEIDKDSYELEQKVYRIGGFSSKDKNSFMRVVLIKPNHTVGDFALSRTLFNTANITFEAIKKNLNHPVTMGLTGPYCTREAEYKTINRDLKLTGFMTTALIVVIMLVGFRNFRCLIYSLVPLTASIYLTMAFTQISIGYLNMITAFMVSILLGMGSDYTLHMLVSIEDDLQSQPDTFSAIEQTYSELWKPLLSSMLTTAVAFYAMIFSTFEGYRHFGIIAGVGIVISFVVVFYGLPSLIVVGQKYFPQQRRVPKPARPITKNLVYTILIAGILLSIYSAINLPEIHFNYDFLDLQAKDDNTLELAERIGKHFGVQLSPVALMTPNRKRADEIAKKINSDIPKNPHTTFDFAAALSTHIPQHQEEKIKLLNEINFILEQRKAVLSKLKSKEKNDLEELRRQLTPTPLTIDDLPSGIKRQYEGDDHAISIVFVYPNDRIIDGHVAKRFVNELRALDFGPDVKLAGDPMIFADVLLLLEKDTPVVLMLSCITVIGLLFIHFRRLDHVLWVLAPVLLGFLWMTGMADIAHLNYNFINMTILPSVLGVGIDSGIYIFDHYRQKRKENFFISMQKTSKGVILSSLTNIAAFASLAYAHHRGMASLGTLGVFGFLSCLLASVYFVPSIIAYFEFKTKHLFHRQDEN